MTVAPRPTDLGPLNAAALAAALRRWRVINRVKQAAAAERLGVAQSTVSRWEAGRQPIEFSEARRVLALVAARPDSAADAALAMLVRESRRAVHLVCDTSHRLLAFSPTRAASFGVDAAGLIGRSLWRFSPPELIAVEAALPDTGWYDAPCPAPIEFETGCNKSRVVPIRPSRCRWTRMTLSDGSAVRLVETL